MHLQPEHQGRGLRKEYLPQCGDQGGDSRPPGAHQPRHHQDHGPILQLRHSRQPSDSGLQDLHPRTSLMKTREADCERGQVGGEPDPL